MTVRIWRLAALAAAALLLAHPASAQQRPTLTLGVQGSPRTLEPVMDNSNVLWRIGYNVFDTLIRVDYKDGGKLVPSLAKEWKRVSPTELEFTLREDVKFHNGESFSADDVIFSVKRIKADGSDMAYTVAAVTEVKKIDDLTVDFIMSKPNPILPLQTTSTYMMSKAWAEKNGGVPINHMVVVHERIARARPDVVEEIFRVFKEARKLDTKAPTGKLDPYRFGVEANRAALERIIDYSVKQQMIPKKFTVDELFDDVTRKLV